MLSAIGTCDMCEKEIGDEEEFHKLATNPEHTEFKYRCGSCEQQRKVDKLCDIWDRGGMF